jgi:hypothetical protein
MTSDSDEVHAEALWHYDGATRASAIPLILLQYRPQAVVKPGSVHVMADALLANLRSVGWESPILMFRGGHLASAGRVVVAGALGNGNVTISGGGHVHYDGPLTRPPGWTEIVRKAGSVGVLAAADPSLDDPEIRHDLATLAEAGKLLAAVGVPQHDTTTLPAGHPLRRPR